MPILADYFKNKDLDDIVVVSPDVGGVTVLEIGRPLVPFAIIDKRRPEPNVAEVMNIVGKVKDKTVIIVDDMVDTAGSYHGVRLFGKRC